MTLMCSPKRRSLYIFCFLLNLGSVRELIIWRQWRFRLWYSGSCVLHVILSTFFTRKDKQTCDIIGFLYSDINLQGRIICSTCVLTIECIYGFHIVLRIKSHEILKWQQPPGVCGGDGLCFVWGTVWIFKYYSDEYSEDLVLKCWTFCCKISRRKTNKTFWFFLLLSPLFV
jgi:hypothetical protein